MYNSQCPRRTRATIMHVRGAVMLLRSKYYYFYLRCAVCSRDRKRCKRVRRFGFSSTAWWWTFCNSHSSSRLYGQPTVRTVTKKKNNRISFLYMLITFKIFASRIFRYVARQSGTKSLKAQYLYTLYTTRISMCMTYIVYQLLLQVAAGVHKARDFIILQGKKKKKTLCMSHAFYPVCVRTAAAVCYYYTVSRDYSRIKRF